jgi:uncharacterized protein (DUF924 family)
MAYDEVLGFWFEETDRKQWWRADAAFDALIRQRFGALHEQAARAELSPWRQAPRGRLAEIIVLDQFSRNLHRGTPRAFAQDAIALVLAQEAVSAGADQALSPLERSFVYLPFMHSESTIIHAQALALYRANGRLDDYDFELRRKAIIDRFGRYPHRNEILGRVSTPEEIEFLRRPGSRF